MRNEHKRLLDLFKNKKITEDEYKLLSKAISPSFSSKTVFLLLNPFRKIAGFWALVLGLVIILTTSYLGTIAQVYFSSVLSVFNASVVKNAKIGTVFSFLLYQNVIILIVLSSILYISARLLKQKQVRLIDFIGTIALSRFPYLFFTFFLAITRVLNPQILNVNLEEGLQFNLSLPTILLSAIGIVCVVWQIITYFYAFKESSGLSGKKLWTSFVTCLLIAELFCSFILMLPVYG